MLFTGGICIDKKEQDMFLAWSKNYAFRQKLFQTQKEIATLIHTYPINSVAVSGGKDSLVLLSLVLEQNPAAFVWHWDYGIYMLPYLEQEVQNILHNYFKLRSPQLTIDRRFSQNPASTTGYKAFFGSVSTYLTIHKIQLNFIGLRKEESCRRKHRCKRLIEEGKPCPNTFPLRDWTWRDIWAYLIWRQIPYPSSYDQKRKLQSWDKIRFVTFFDPEFAHLGSVDQDNFLFFQAQ